MRSLRVSMVGVYRIGERALFKLAPLLDLLGRYRIRPPSERKRET
jgi:hypothetical protein